MRFCFPCYPASFEIPDEWMAEAGIIGHQVTTAAFASTDQATHVPLLEVEPPFRSRSAPLDFAGFDRPRMVRILAGFVAGATIDPVTIIRLPLYEFAPCPFRYRVWNGLHRFYASISAGFTHLPVQDETPPQASLGNR